MNKLLLKIVLVRLIPAPTEKFDLNEIHALAEASLEMGGFIQPPVLRRKGTGYEVISGHKQVAAAHAAKLIDPRNGEAIPVMLIEPEMEEVAAKQMTPAPTPIPTAETESTPEPTARRKPSPPKLPEEWSWRMQNIKDMWSMAELKKKAHRDEITVKGDKRLKETWIKALGLE